jgi:hypothetical protein
VIVAVSVVVVEGVGVAEGSCTVIATAELHTERETSQSTKEYTPTVNVPGSCSSWEELCAASPGQVAAIEDVLVRRKIERGSGAPVEDHVAES